MKTLVLVLLLASTVVFAAPNKSRKVRFSKLNTNHNFEDKLIDGKYQYPDEANAKVDDEKLLDDLIGVRKNFRDRMKESAQRR